MIGIIEMAYVLMALGFTIEAILSYTQSESAKKDNQFTKIVTYLFGGIIIFLFFPVFIGILQIGY